MASITENGGRIRKGEGNCDFKEVLRKPIEVRLADLEKDAEAIASIFNNPDVIVHLAGVAPAVSDRKIDRFRANIAKYIPSLKELPEEQLKKIADQIIIATPAEIKAFYAKFPNIEAYVAVANGKVVGTVSLETPVHPGDRMGIISKLAISPDAPSVGNSTRGKGIGKKLIQFLNNRMFDPKQLGLDGATATIMQRVEGELAPKHLFEDEGYESTGGAGRHLGWDTEQKIFVPRSFSTMQRLEKKASGASK